MIEFKSNIVITPTILYRTRNVLLINALVIFIFIFTYFYVEITNKNFVFFFILMIIIVVNSFFDGMYENPKPYIKNELLFNDHKIIIDKKLFDLKSLKNVEIIYDAFDGERIKTGSNRYRVSNGTDNYLTIYSDNEIIAHQFYVKSESEEKNLKNVLLAWYINNYNFYEGFDLGRTYLLKSLSYVEVQEFKMKIEELRNDHINKMKPHQS